MKPGNGYSVLKPKDWTPPREPLPYGPSTHAVELMAQARLMQLQSPPRRTYPQQSYIGRIFIPSSMCPLCIEHKRAKALARAFWDAHQSRQTVTMSEIERFAGIIERDF